MVNPKKIFYLFSLFLVLVIVHGCETGEDNGSEYVYSCRYYNQMSNGDECVEYRGDWTLEEAEHYLEMSKSTICGLARESNIPLHWAGRIWRFDAVELV